MNNEELFSEYLSKLLIVVPAYNEEASLRFLVQQLRDSFPSTPILIVDDGSQDNTAAISKLLGVKVLLMPHNVGVGSAMQAAYCYAVANGFKGVLRLDADGQHPPCEAIKLIEEHLKSGADLVVGSRYGGDNEKISSGFRSFGSRCLSSFLTMFCKRKISDPTSGFWLVSSPLIEYFAKDFPVDYPEPEAIALLFRLGYTYSETSVNFRCRQHGKSSIRGFDTIYFIIKVGLALVIDRVRHLNKRCERRHVVKSLQLYSGNGEEC